jgi:hypothetical protein
MSPAMMILGVIVVILLYMYFFYKTGETKLGDKIMLDKASPIAKKDVIDPKSQVYSFETWVYINQYDGTGKELFYKGAVGARNIEVSISGASPTLIVKYLTNESTPAQKSLTVTDNFPIQTWVHVIVSVDSNYIDVYVNGKLTKSIKESQGIKMPDDVAIEFGDWGQNKCSLAKFYRRTYATDPATAWTLYNDGNGSNRVSKYLGTLGMDVTLKKDSVEYSKLNIF